MNNNVFELINNRYFDSHVQMDSCNTFTRLSLCDIAVLLNFY